MRKTVNQTLSRRVLLAGAVSIIASAQQVNSANQQESFELGNGLVVRDFRLFPSVDVMRFIVEIHNTTGNAVDTPSVGVILPHLNDDENFGWATPIAPVLHPHTSGGLFGVAPGGLKTDADWGVPKWLLCQPDSTSEADKLTPWEIDVSSELIFHDDVLEYTVAVTNQGSQTTTTDLWLNALHWDKNNRICGPMNMISIAGIESGVTWERRYYLAEEVHYHHPNPFILIDTVDGVDITFSLQPTVAPIAAGCSPVMPWNR